MQLVDLIEHAIDGNGVLFAGSGFSRSAKNIAGDNLKTSGSLAAYLSQECGLAEPASLDDVADLCIAKHGATELVDLLTREFQVTELGPEHAIFGRIPWRRVYTTNYDDAIELAYKHNRRAVVPITLGDDVRRVSEASSQCVHINGFINGLTKETLFSTFKLTDTSYSSSAFSESAWASQFRHDISAAFAIIFVGYSAWTSSGSCWSPQRAKTRRFSLLARIQTKSPGTSFPSSVK
jgi:hypothetical protein